MNTLKRMKEIENIMNNDETLKKVCGYYVGETKGKPSYELCFTKFTHSIVEEKKAKENIYDFVKRNDGKVVKETITSIIAVF